jgi:3-polyprenyl-4-hydroxybenzoate decarboxylase
MLGSSKMAIPKVAYVFDGDVDIWDDNQVKWALAFRFDPIRDTVIIPCMNTMTVDPMIAKDDPPATISKIGFDCTIPWGEKRVQSDFQRSTPFELGDPPAGVSSMTEDAIAKEMESFIRSAPRSGRKSCSTSRGKTTAMSIAPSDGCAPAWAAWYSRPSFPTRSAIPGTSLAMRSPRRQQASIACITNHEGYSKAMSPTDAVDGSSPGT